MRRKHSECNAGASPATRHRLISLCVSAFLLALFPGCLGAHRVGEPFDRAPSVDTQKLRLGEAVFMERCHQCHPHGEGGLGPALNTKPLPQPLIHLQIRKGMGAMPGFSEELITEIEADAVTDYVKALRQAAT